MLDEATRGREPDVTSQVQDTRLRHLLAAQDHVLAELGAMVGANLRVLFDLGVAQPARGIPAAPMSVDASASTALHTTMRKMRDTVAALPRATTERLDEARAVLSRDLASFPFQQELVGVRDRLETLAADSATIRRLAVTSGQEHPQVLSAIRDRQRRLDDGAARLQILLAEFFQIFC
jgi:hypothetical protein